MKGGFVVGSEVPENSLSLFLDLTCIVDVCLGAILSRSDALRDAITKTIKAMATMATIGSRTYVAMVPGLGPD